MDGRICEAITKRAVLRFTYDGGPRTVEPHCHGTSRADNEVLRAWQTGGHSESGEAVGWKLFEVAGISGLQVTGTTFQGTRPDYNPGDKHMKRVHCHL